MKIFIKILIVLFCIGVCDNLVLAGVKTFVGPGNDWNDATNWSPQSVPVMGDDVVIPSGKSVVCSYSDYGIHSIKIEEDADVVFNNSLVVGYNSFDRGQIASIEVYGKITVNGNINSNPLIIGETGSVVCTGEVIIGNDAGELKVNGKLETKGQIKCAPLYVGASASVVCGGGLSVNNGNAHAGNKYELGVADIYGEVVVKGDLTCGALKVKNGGSISVAGDAKINYGNLNNKNFPGELELGGNVEVGGTLLAGDLEVSDPSGASIDFGSINIRYDQTVTNKILEELYSAGIAKRVVEYKWKGKYSSNWFLAENWEPNGIPTISDKVYIENEASCSPVIDSKDKIAFAKMIYVMGDKSLTINPGSSLYSKYLYVEQKDREGVVTINHRYDAMCSFRLYSGRIGVGTKWYVGNEEYKKIRINKTLKTGVTYYMGSATLEGEFEGLNNLNDLTTADYDEIYSYDVNEEKYIRSNGFGGLGDAGSLYLYWKVGSAPVAEERTVSQVGTIQNTDNNVIVELRSYKTGDYGWNLISNPYQFSFPLNNGVQFVRDGVESVYFRRYNTETKKYESIVYSFETGVAIPNTVPSSELYIAPQQGFFVKGYDGMDFKFVPSAVASDESIIKNAKLKNKASVSDVLYLSLSTDVTKKSEDQTALVFRKGGTIEVNRIDADKKRESAANNQLYLLKDDAQYAIGLYPTVSEVSDVELRIGMIPAQGATEMTLKAINLDEFDASTDVYLIDKENNDKSYNLRETESVTFPVVKSGTAINDRFAIVLKTNKSLEVDDEDEGDEVATEISAVENDDNVVICRLDENNAVVKVSEVKENMTANVYDIAGRKLVTKVIKSGEEVISLGAGKGLYVVTVNEGNRTKAAVKISK